MKNDLIYNTDMCTFSNLMFGFLFITDSHGFLKSIERTTTIIW